MQATEGYWSPQAGLQDMALGIKIRPLYQDWGSVGAVSLMGSFVFTTPLTDYIADAPVAIGHQATQYEGRLLAQYKHPSGLFALVSGGYIQRRNVIIDRGYAVSVPDVWDYVFRTGFAYTALYADAWLQVQQARSGTDIGPGVPFPSNAVSFTRLGFTLYKNLPFAPHFGATLGSAFTLGGENIGKSTRFQAGMVYRVSFVH